MQLIAGMPGQVCNCELCKQCYVKSELSERSDKSWFELYALAHRWATVSGWPLRCQSKHVKTSVPQTRMPPSQKHVRKSGMQKCHRQLPNKKDGDENCSQIALGKASNSVAASSGASSTKARKTLLAGSSSKCIALVSSFQLSTSWTSVCPKRTVRLLGAHSGSFDCLHLSQ